MSNKWLKKEGPKWVEQNIISEQQYEQILAQYDDKQHGFGILTVLGSVLIGLGILIFIAANWQDIPQLLRLCLVIVIMVSFYAGGTVMHERGNKTAGTALLGIGLLSFGANIFLIAQMYHLTSSSTASFIIWSIAGLALLYLYGSRYIFILTAVILNIAQYVSIFEFDSFNYIVFSLTALGLGFYALRAKDRMMMIIAMASTVMHFITWLAKMEYSFLWVYLFIAFLYVLGDLLHKQISRWSVQIIPLLTAFLLGAWFAVVDFTYFDLEEMLQDLNVPVFSLIWIALFIASAYLKFKKNAASAYSIADWLLFLPVFLIGSGIDWMYLILLFVYSLFILLDGYREQNRTRVNAGTLMFLFVALLAYFKLAWDFMDKSIMFITGGVLLFVLSWFLNRRRKQLFNGEGGDEQ